MNADVIVRGVCVRCKRVLKIDAECVITSMDCEANFGRFIDGISLTVIVPSRWPSLVVVFLVGCTAIVCDFYGPTRSFILSSDGNLKVVDEVFSS